MKLKFQPYMRDVLLTLYHEITDSEVDYRQDGVFEAAIYLPLTPYRQI